MDCSPVNLWNLSNSQIIYIHIYKIEFTKGEEYWRVLIYGNVPKGDIDGHGTEEQAHAARDPLGTCERTPWGGIHYWHPDVFIPEASRRSALENIPDRKKQKPLTTLITTGDFPMNIFRAELVYFNLCKVVHFWPEAGNLVVLCRVESFLGHAVSAVSAQPAFTEEVKNMSCLEVLYGHLVYIPLYKRNLQFTFTIWILLCGKWKC